MKRRICFYLLTMLSLIETTALAHDIEAANLDGVTIYYNWIKNNTELAVSFKGSGNYWITIMMKSL